MYKRQALGVMDTYCFPNDLFATCDSLVTFTAPCSADTDCGAADLDDGVCAGEDPNKACTYRCSGARDCDANVCPGGGKCPLQ